MEIDTEIIKFEASALLSIPFDATRDKVALRTPKCIYIGYWHCIDTGRAFNLRKKVNHILYCSSLESFHVHAGSGMTTGLFVDSESSKLRS